ncbi:hypothetical protein ACFTAO_47245 [Paenibacillus rhizoplanae]
MVTVWVRTKLNLHSITRKRFIRLGIIISLIVGVIIAAGSKLYVSAFNISEDAKQMSMYIVIVFAGFLWVKVSNMIIAGGILNSGGTVSSCSPWNRPQRG